MAIRQRNLLHDQIQLRAGQLHGDVADFARGVAVPAQQRIIASPVNFLHIRVGARLGAALGRLFRKRGP